MGYAESRRRCGTVKLPRREVNDGKDDNGKDNNAISRGDKAFGEERNNAIMVRRARVRMKHFVELGRRSEGLYEKYKRHQRTGDSRLSSAQNAPYCTKGLHFVE